MKRLLLLFSLPLGFMFLAQTNPLQDLIEAARTHSPRLAELINSGLPQLQGRDGAAVWGNEFLFAVQSDKPATVAINHQIPLAMTNIPGTKIWYRLAVLRLGTTHNYNFFAEGKSLGTYDVAGYNPDSYPQPGVIVTANCRGNEKRSRARFTRECRRITGSMSTRARILPMARR